jgi:hypothetical protein
MSFALRISKIDIPVDPGARDPYALERHRVPLRGSHQQLHHKTGRDVAAAILPALVFLGIELAAAIVEVGLRFLA